MVQAQQARNVKILGLVITMEETFSFVVSADELKSHPVLQDIMEEILKQTIECGYFIQVYTRRDFGGMYQASGYTTSNPESNSLHICPLRRSLILHDFDVKYVSLHGTL